MVVTKVEEDKRKENNLKDFTTKFKNDFSKEIYEQTYKFGDEDIDKTLYRVAKDLASIEEDPEKWTYNFLDLLTDFKFVPGGRITSNAGTSLKGTSMINCFVDGFLGEDQDSMESILDALRRQALILKSEGGYGFCADVMRPRGSYINGIGNESPGAVKMLDMWDTQSSVITEGSGKKSQRKDGKVKIRKGAQMVTMSCWHGDIEEFITAKQTPGRLTKFNMSVLITDEFMNAVENNLPWNLEFPDYDKAPEEYKKEWNGNLRYWKEKGYPTVIYKTYENANQLWDIIMESTYSRNEPGVLFIDTINKLNNLKYIEYINSTNPCGEQVLPIGGVCLLGSINLTQFIDFKNKNWDYTKLEKYIPYIVRLMDNVNDKTYVPLEYQNKNLKEKRRIGLGIMGYGSSLMMLKLRYGSKEALELTENLMKFISNNAYKSSALLAKEKGHFELFDPDEYLDSNFIKQSIDSETIELIRKYGIRNSHLLSIQPTGNSSIYANNVSGGLEPIFLSEYVRTSIMPYAPDGLDKPRNIDWENKTYESSTKWDWMKEGDDSLLTTQFDGYKWKFDKGRGLLRETIVEDYAVSYLKSINEWNEDADWASTTSTLNIDDHVNTMAVMSKYIDSAMSKCIVKGTLISTDKGIIPIESLSDNDVEDSFKVTKMNYKILDENGDLKNITNHYYGGEKDCYSITFNNGFKIETAYTHMLKTEEGWKNILDLEKGDNVYFRTNNIEVNSDYIEIKNKPIFHNSSKYKIPDVMNEDYAKFIGMMLSDGFTNKNSIGIVEKNNKVGIEIDRLFKILFNVDVKIDIDKRSGVKTHILHSRYLSKYYKEFIGTNAVTKKIPDEILLSNDNVKISFIKGLTLDGYINSNDKNLVIYEGYSKDIQLKVSYILSSLGYNYHMRKKSIKNGRLSKKSYSIKAYLTDNKISTIEEHKMEYAITGKKQRQVFVENKELYNDLPISNSKNYYLFRNLRKSLKSSSFTKKELLDKLEIEYDNNLTCVVVKNIEYIGKRKVYDIEVEDTHSYLINGVVSHNTVNIPNNYSYDEFKDLYKKLYKTGTVKGGTTYRAGTMTAVLSSVTDSASKKQETNTLPKTQSPKRPKTLFCDIHQLQVNGEKWIVIVGLYGDKKDPYEVFAFKKKEINLSGNIKNGYLSKVKSGRYDLDINGVIIEDVKKHFETREEEALTRMISTALRHGADINFIYEQLQKSEGTIVSFSKAIARTLKKYLKDDGFAALDCESCGSKGTLVMQEGCYVCKSCGFSKCS